MATRPMTLVQSRRVGFARQFRSLVQAGAIAALCLLGAAGCMTPQPPLAQDGAAGADERALAARNVGIDHLAKGRLAMSLRLLGQAESIDPDDPETQLWLGEAYRRKGHLEKAEEHFIAALEIAPGHHTARLSLAALYAQMKLYDEAIIESDLLVEDPLYGQPWKALTNRGWAQYKLGQTEPARSSFLEALEFRYQYWPAYLNLGIIERESGNPLKAIEYFRSVIDLELGYGADAEAHYRLGELYVSLGKRNDAITQFTEALVSTPHGTWASQSKSYLELLR